VEEDFIRDSGVETFDSRCPKGGRDFEVGGVNDLLPVGAVCVDLQNEI
jgi:hypothetical protein